MMNNDHSLGNSPLFHENENPLVSTDNVDAVCEKVGNLVLGDGPGQATQLHAVVAHLALGWPFVPTRQTAFATKAATAVPSKTAVVIITAAASPTESADGTAVPITAAPTAELTTAAATVATAERAAVKAAIEGRAPVIPVKGGVTVKTARPAAIPSVFVEAKGVGGSVFDFLLQDAGS